MKKLIIGFAITAFAASSFPAPSDAQCLFYRCGYCVRDRSKARIPAATPKPAAPKSVAAPKPAKPKPVAKSKPIEKSKVVAASKPANLEAVGRVAALKAAINCAVTKFHRNDDPPECNYVAAAVADSLGRQGYKIPYFRNTNFGETGYTRNEADMCPIRGQVANQMYDFIKKAVCSPASGWVLCRTAAECQKAANEGKFAVGVGHSPDGKEHGHIVVVYPDTAASSNFISVKSNLSWDGSVKEPTHRLYDQPFGIKSKTGKPIWAVYDPDRRSKDIPECCADGVCSP